jgi:hypothetical protein
MFFGSKLDKKKFGNKVVGGKSFALPNISQGGYTHLGYTYTMAKPAFQLLVFSCLCTKVEQFLYF